MTLVEFLLTRIAEDEAVARECPPPDRWWVTGDFDRGDNAGAAAHLFVDEWLPARVLAQCAAHRAIVEECRILDAQCCDCGAHSRADDMLRALAGIYADRAGFREEWR